MSKYLVTGIGGFVGRYFWEYIKQNEPDSIVIGYDIIKDSPIIDNNFVYQCSNLMDRDLLIKQLNEYKPDYIVHLAALSSVGQSWKAPSDCFINNTSIFLNIVEAVRSVNKNIRILAIGSSEEYGNTNSKDKISEDYHLNPQSPYAVAKVSQEQLAKMYVDGFGVDIVLTRSFNHFGPRQSDRFVIPSFVKQITEISQGKASSNDMRVGNIEVVRDFLDVRDVVCAYYSILKKANSGAIYNVCSGVPRKIAEIITEASKILNVKVNVIVDESRLRPNENMWILGDNQKLENELQWKIKYSFSQTLLDMITFFKG